MYDLLWVFFFLTLPRISFCNTSWVTKEALSFSIDCTILQMSGRERQSWLKFSDPRDWIHLFFQICEDTLRMNSMNFSLQNQTYLQRVFLTNLYISSWKVLFYDPRGRAIVAQTEAHSDMRKKFFIFTCAGSRLATAFLKENFARIPISKCLGHLWTLVLSYFGK